MFEPTITQPSQEPCADGPGAVVISVRGLRRSYGEHEAVRGIDLDVRRGEILAVLGPNGAGKTTTVEILEGFRTASAGEVRVLGEDPTHAGGEWRERIGIVLQESQPEPFLTVRECVALYAGYYRRPRGVEETLALVGLERSAEVRGEQLSGGQRRRLDVALALVGDPELVFLDEPTTGFDPSARRASWEMVDGLRALGKTIVLTTHYMEEAERLADRIVVLADGEVVAEGTPQTLGGRDHALARIGFTLPGAVAFEQLPAALRAIASRERDRRVVLQSAGVVHDLGLLTTWATERKVELRDLEVRRPTLEDVYLALTGAAA